MAAVTQDGWMPPTPCIHQLRLLVLESGVVYASGLFDFVTVLLHGRYAAFDLYLSYKTGRDLPHFGKLVVGVGGWPPMCAVLGTPSSSLAAQKLSSNPIFPCARIPPLATGCARRENARNGSMGSNGHVRRTNLSRGPIQRVELSLRGCRPFGLKTVLLWAGIPVLPGFCVRRSHRPRWLRQASRSSLTCIRHWAGGRARNCRAFGRGCFCS
jgi:hypothetical protein